MKGGKASFPQNSGRFTVVDINVLYNRDISECNPTTITSVSRNAGGFTRLDITVLHKNDMSECNPIATPSILPQWEKITHFQAVCKMQEGAKIYKEKKQGAMGCSLPSNDGGGRGGEGRDSVDHARRDRSNVHVKEMYFTNVIHSLIETTNVPRVAE